ncbi:restriction endonuclease subunit S [Acinetobacter baumannii]|uniref:restriction endonuclease subunit S n=1 Tax=Acinetobacter baumannii TaxID=470 RepID=UPI003891A057
MFPKLRFKEFDGDWLKLKYKDVLTIKYGKDHKSLNDGDIPVLGTGGIMRYVDSYLYDGESILIGRKGTIDKPQYINEKFWTVDTLFYTEIKENIVPLFLFQHALEVNWLGLNEATGVPSLNTTSIYNVDISIPSKEEQTKIVTFLSAVDEKISQLTQKHELLSQYKQGMMQKLFSQQIRFKADDGSEFEEWVDGKLGDITNIQGGFAFKSTDFGKGDTKVLRIGDIQKNIDLDRFEGITSSEIPDSRYLVYKDSIVMALSGATFGKLGKVKSGSAFINQRVATFTSKEKSINEFLYQVMLSQDFYNYIQSIPSASAQPNISNQDVINYKLNFPCLEEQTKIANFLSAIDQKIEVVAQQIEQAKTWKKGLLQQMFV